MAPGRGSRQPGRFDAVPHGFRSSFRDWAAECTDAPWKVCELALAHVNRDRVGGRLPALGAVRAATGSPGAVGRVPGRGRGRGSPNKRSDDSFIDRLPSSNLLGRPTPSTHHIQEPSDGVDRDAREWLGPCFFPGTNRISSSTRSGDFDP